MSIYNLFWAIYQLTYAFRDIVYKFTGKFNPWIILMKDGVGFIIRLVG